VHVLVFINYWRCHNFFTQTCQISRSPSNLHDLGVEGTVFRNYSLSDRLSHLESLHFFLKSLNDLTSKFWPHLIQCFVIVNLCGKILACRQMFEAKQGVPVTSTSPARIMLNDLQYITDRITLKLTTYNFTVTLMYTAEIKVYLFAPNFCCMKVKGEVAWLHN